MEKPLMKQGRIFTRHIDAVRRPSLALEELLDRNADGEDEDADPPREYTAEYAARCISRTFPGSLTLRRTRNWENWKKLHARLPKLLDRLASSTDDDLAVIYASVRARPYYLTRGSTLTRLAQLRRLARAQRDRRCAQAREGCLPLG